MKRKFQSNFDTVRCPATDRAAAGNSTCHYGVDAKPDLRVGKQTFFWILISSFAFYFATVHAGYAQQFEIPTDRLASNILPANQLAGTHYRIQGKVVSYGYMHHWTVKSDFGTFEVTGDGALRKLIKEINAIAVLRKIKKSKAFFDSVKFAAKAPFRLAGNLIRNPVSTISGIPKGVFQIFGNVGKSISMKHDPSEDSRLKQALQVSSWKRDYAYKYGVDVYSSNKVLQKELNSVGWAAAIGGLSVAAMTTAANVSALTVASRMRLSDQLNKVLKAEPPARLRIINQKKLSAMGISQSLAKRFLDHPAYTPRHDTVLVEALRLLQGARGRGAFLELSLSAQDEVGANFYQIIAETMRGYHLTVSPVSDITVMAGLVLARAKDGSVVIPFPLDHGVWTERASQLAIYLKANYRAPGFQNQFELWVTGTLSPLARQQLNLIGFKVTEDVDKHIQFAD